MQRTERPKNKHDKTGTKRQSKRNQQLEQAARNNGFDSLSQMLTAIMKGQAVVVRVVKGETFSQQEKLSC